VGRRQPLRCIGNALTASDQLDSQSDVSAGSRGRKAEAPQCRQTNRGGERQPEFRTPAR
jgi:hypothetical protein